MKYSGSACMPGGQVLVSVGHRIGVKLYPLATWVACSGSRVECLGDETVHRQIDRSTLECDSHEMSIDIRMILKSIVISVKTNWWKLKLLLSSVSMRNKNQRISWYDFYAVTYADSHLSWMKRNSIYNIFTVSAALGCWYGFQWTQ